MLERNGSQNSPRLSGLSIRGPRLGQRRSALVDNLCVRLHFDLALQQQLRLLATSILASRYAPTTRLQRACAVLGLASRCQSPAPSRAGLPFFIGPSGKRPTAASSHLVGFDPRLTLPGSYHTELDFDQHKGMAWVTQLSPKVSKASSTTYKRFTLVYSCTRYRYLSMAAWRMRGRLASYVFYLRRGREPCLL